MADYPAGASFGPRPLSDHEFVWVLQGSAVWTVHRRAATGEFVPDHEHLLRPGTLALAQAFTVDSYHWDPARSRRTRMCTSKLAEPGLSIPEEMWPATRSLVASPVLSGLCDYLLEAGPNSERRRPGTQRPAPGSPARPLRQRTAGRARGVTPSLCRRRAASSAYTTRGAPTARASWRRTKGRRVERLRRALVPHLSHRVRLRTGAGPGAGPAGPLRRGATAQQRLAGGDRPTRRLRQRVSLLASLRPGVRDAAGGLPRPGAGTRPAQCGTRGRPAADRGATDGL